MSSINYLTPKEIAESTINIGIKKVKQPVINMVLLGILAGVFIAFAAEGSNMAAFNLLAKSDTYGLGKALAGVVFSTGLMFVLIAGGELFTGNMLITVAVLDKKVKIKAMLKNWIFVMIGNFIGSILIAYMMNKSGLFLNGANMLGGITIKIAVTKVSLNFQQAFFLGIMCNWIVCLAVWMSYGAKDMAGKILAIFFPISLFITSGFEHSVANMYYITAGIFAKNNSEFIETATQLGVTSEKLAHLNWGTFFLKNLIPVTLGNIVGGAVCVAGVYWFIYLRKSNNSSKA